MNLKWNIEEIKQRKEEVIKKLKSDALDGNYLKLHNELLDLCSMTFFANGSNTDDSFLTKAQQKFILRHDQHQVSIGVKKFVDNNSMHSIFSRKIIETFNRVHFNHYEGDYEKVSVKDNVELISDFLDEYDSEQFAFFNYLIENDKINISNRKLTFYQGITFLSSTNSYILCQNFQNINLAVTLIHEYGHAYAHLINNYQHLDKNESLSEINSHFMEYIFLNYLIERDIFKDDALLIQNNNYYDLYLFTLQLLILTTIEDLKCEENYTIINEQNEIRKSILKLEDVRYSELLNFTDSLNLYEILKYAYGNLMGLIYSNQYNDSKKITDLKDVISGNKLLKDIVTLDGLEKSLILNNKRMN